jgi:hypothetical protein
LNEMIVGFYDSNLDNNGINNIIIRKQTTFRLSDLQKFHVVGKDTTVLECSILSLDEQSAFHVPSHYDTATPGFSEINHQILELALVVNDVSPIRELYSLITAEQQEALLMSTTCDTPHGMIDIFTFAISQQIHLDAVKALFQIQNKQLIANFLIRECTGEATMPLHFAMENNARDKANYLFELYQEHDLLEFIRDHNDISIFYIAVEKGFWHIARSLFDACKDDDMKIHLLSQSYDHEKGDEQAFQQLEKQLQYLRNELQTNPLDALIQQKLEVCTFLYAESNRLQLDLICTRSEDEGENVESADNVILEFPQLDPEDVAAINAMIGESNGVE